MYQAELDLYRYGSRTWKGEAALKKAKASSCDNDLVDCGCVKGTLSEAGMMTTRAKRWGNIW